MRITVLGKSPSWPDANGACSGYLIQEGDFNLLLDCGGGVVGKLRGRMDYFAVDAVLITHLHSDHFFDLVPFSYGLLHSPRRSSLVAQGLSGQPELFAPPGAREVFRATVGAWGDEKLIETAFALSEYDPAAAIEIGPLRARFCEVPHFTRTFSVELQSENGRFTFGADCGPNDAIVAFARGTDLLLLEATLGQPDSNGSPGHMTARQAGEHGRQAGARRLVITHFSDELDAARTSAAAEAGFGAPVELAREGARYEV